MIQDFLMPKLGHLQETGTVLEWCKEPGQSFRKGEALFVVDTEKTSLEVEADFDGSIVEILTAAGETVPVNAPIARVEKDG